MLRDVFRPFTSVAVTKAMYAPCGTCVESRT